MQTDSEEEEKVSIVSTKQNKQGHLIKEHSSLVINMLDETNLHINS